MAWQKLGDVTAELLRKVKPDPLTPPDDAWVDAVCRIGQGEACCRYLLMGPDGWECGSGTSLKSTLDTRAEAGLMVARAVNCSGRGAR